MPNLSPPSSPSWPGDPKAGRLKHREDLVDGRGAACAQTLDRRCAGEKLGQLLRRVAAD
ncbi:MAG TPA: hypothetical protein PLO41_14055 [Rubrivivax sp.]|nr:hypothetical protein [Rubrivivax sp.]